MMLPTPVNKLLFIFINGSIDDAVANMLFAETPSMVADIPKFTASNRLFDIALTLLEFIVSLSISDKILELTNASLVLPTP